HRVDPRRHRLPQDHDRAMPDDRRTVADPGQAAGRGPRGGADQGMSGALAIRRAALPDAAALSAIGRETFVLTFGHLYAPEDLAAFLDESHSVASYAALLEDPRYGLWLLEGDGEGGHKHVAGFAVAGPCGLP